MRIPLACLLLAAACQSPPPAQFRYASTSAWRADHPQGQPGAQCSDVWAAPDSDGRLLRVHGAVDLHFHAGREEWIYVVDGSGSLTVGPDAAGFVADPQMIEYPVAAGDWFLVPRGTAHAFRGNATVISIFSPPMPDPPDRVLPVPSPGGRSPAGG